MESAIENIKRADVNIIATNLGYTPRYVNYVLKGERGVKSRVAKNILKAAEILQESKIAIQNLKNQDLDTE